MQSHEAAPIHGLVLIGGMSERMGCDKSLLDYHGRPQREHLARLLQGFCRSVHLSCRAGQEVASEFPVLVDAYQDMGPLAALLTAFDAHPDAAWLVVACDLPLVDEALLGELLAARDPGKIATAFRNPAMDFPEPLITLWEPAAQERVRQSAGVGGSCPRRVLSTADIVLVEPEEPSKLLNANRPDEYERIRRVLANTAKPSG